MFPALIHAMCDVFFWWMILKCVCVCVSQSVVTVVVAFWFTSLAEIRFFFLLTEYPYVISHYFLFQMHFYALHPDWTSSRADAADEEKGTTRRRKKKKYKIDSRHWIRTIISCSISVFKMPISSWSFGRIDDRFSKFMGSFVPLRFCVYARAAMFVVLCSNAMPCHGVCVCVCCIYVCLSTRERMLLLCWKKRRCGANATADAARRDGRSYSILSFRTFISCGR